MCLPEVIAKKVFKAFVSPFLVLDGHGCIEQMGVFGDRFQGFRAGDISPRVAACRELFFQFLMRYIARQSRRCE